MQAVAAKELHESLADWLAACCTTSASFDVPQAAQYPEVLKRLIFLW